MTTTAAAPPRALTILVLCLLGGIVAGLWPGPDAWAQGGGDTTSTQVEAVVPLADRMDAAAQEWQPELDAVEGWLNRPWSGRADGELDVLAQRLRAVRDAAQQFRDAAANRVAETERLVEALGPPPEAGAAAEPPEMRKRRAATQKDLAAWRARLAETEVAITRAEALLTRITEVRRSSLLSKLVDPTPLPWRPEVLATAGPDILAGLAAIAAAPVDWAKTLAIEDWTDRALGVVALWIVIGGSLGGLARWWLLRRFGRDPAIADPTYVQRTLAAVSEGLSNGIVPAVILGGLILWVRVDWQAEGLFPVVVEGALKAALFLVVVYGFARAALAPGLAAWRLSSHTDAQAQTLFRILLLLGVVLAINLFLVALLEALTPTQETLWLVTALLKLVEGGILVRLTAVDVWRPQKAEPTATDRPSGAVMEDDDSREGEGALRLILSLLRLAVVLLALVGMGAGLAGYGRLGAFLVNGLMITGLVAGLGLVVRGVLRDLIGLLTGWTPVRRALGLQAAGLDKLRFWMKALLDPLLLAAWVILVAPVWRVPSRDVIDGVRTLLTGLSIGSVEVSLVDIAIGIAAFLIAMTLTRVVQGTLQRRVLIHVGMEPGARHALTAGLGYLGVVVAATLAVAVMGIDLTNIAVIVGALSVGIGFGLQNIVNNFVSGLIILIERPIKVGDWVLIGAHEGLVKKVSFRATELETWTQATVILPNADILSQPFTNMTHRNRLGRIDVKVRVPFGTDTARVEEILLEVAQGHDQVLALPAPWVILADFADSALAFELRSYTANVMNRLVISSDLRLEIDRRFRKEGFVMPYPHRVVLGSQPGPEPAGPPPAADPLPPPQWMG